MPKDPLVVPLNTIVFAGETSIISQVRVCRLCKIFIQVTDGNYRMYFEKEDRIALHEHIQCPELGYFALKPHN